MKITENSNNYFIEQINGTYTVVCRSPYGSRCVKVLNRLSSDDLNEVTNMWNGYKETSIKIGNFKK